MANWICPICGEPLHNDENSLRCCNRHCFDRGKSGYVNLLLVQEKNSKIPGDNREMVNARRDFLSKGYYAALAQAFSQAAARQMAGNVHPVILDAGCGEGYYTDAMRQALQKEGAEPEIFAVDISKFAADKCARRCRGIECAAASVFRLPLAAQSCDLAASLFAPYCGEEFLRVLRPNGKFIMVIPGKMHLWELKEALYDQPYVNEVQDYTLDGFSFLESIQIEDTITLPSPQDIRSLFQMTPYAYTSSIEAEKRLDTLQELTTRISFEVLIYEKKKS